MTKIEIVSSTLDDIKEINKSTADRIIFLAGLDQGGLTPSLELVREARGLTNIPIRVMIRNKSEDYIYDEEEMKEMIDYIISLKGIGVEGIVFGSLTSDNKIDFDNLEKVILAKGDLKITFNKAFDELDESIAITEYKKLMEYDIDCLMTVGTKANLYEGADIINKISDLGTITIMPAAGISLDNAKELKDMLNAKYFHVGSAVRDNGNISLDKISKLQEILK